ncbi:hypothetical protein L195_g056583 [Trifolium pratense]|uniref:Uncharacterized protein n=1 Tax=Trifolium pratense TaxID=57577 RepID=A0A2K3KSD6_TRIPR|nr:hypothetical protein L195_g056583 [Trifolium pratense]
MITKKKIPSCFHYARRGDLSTRSVVTCSEDGCHCQHHARREKSHARRDRRIELRRGRGTNHARRDGSDARRGCNLYILKSHFLEGVFQRLRVARFEAYNMMGIHPLELELGLSYFTMRLDHD